MVTLGLHLRKLRAFERIDLDQTLAHAVIDEAAHCLFEIALGGGPLLVDDVLQRGRMHQCHALVTVLCAERFKMARRFCCVTLANASVNALD
jgi:hypothetical protein